jgi:Tol biopolymer transport system component
MDQFSGAPSPDGRYISYVDAKNGDLAVFELETKKDRLLTHNASLLKFGTFRPTWSPDSSRIAYAWWNIKDVTDWMKPDVSCDLRIVELDSAEPRIFYRNPDFLGILPFDWSPDGKHILAGMIRKNLTGQVALLSVADGSEHVIKEFDKPIKLTPRNMLFSPDGSYIVYDFPQGRDTTKRDIFLLSNDGSQELVLIENPADDIVIGWAADGKRVLFTSDRTGTNDIWMIHILDGKPKGDPEIIKKDIGPIVPLGLSYKGAFYYALQTSLWDTYIAKLDIEKGKLFAPQKMPIQRFVGSNGCPEWSPDGKYLAFKTWRRPDNDVGSRGLHIRSLESGEEHEFIPEFKIYYEIRWSPDSRSILTIGLNKDDHREIYKIDIQTGDVTPIIKIDPDRFAQWATWFPDGKKILYTSFTRSRDYCPILMCDLVTKHRKEIYHKPATSPYDLALSPDGQFVAFVTFYSKTLSRILNVMPISGGEPRELLKTKRGEQISTLAWAPNGQWLIFGKRQGNQEECELWRIPVEGGEPQKLGLTMERLNYLTIHPDGQRIAFHASQSSNEIWVMENFLPN